MIIKIRQVSLLISMLFLLAVAGCKKSDVITNLPSINDANNKVVGAAAKDLLSAANYTSVKIEIQYMPGFQPDAASVNNLIAFINSLINKPGGVTVVQTQIAASGKASLSLAEIGQIETHP